MTGRDVTVVGVDVGGTKSEAVVLDATGRERARRRGPGAAVAPHAPGRTADAVAELLRRMEAEGELALPAAALCAGVAGAGRDEVRSALGGALEEAGLASTVSVVPDGEVALHDAHGGEPGLVLIAGTGSSAWGRDVGGRTARAGGWGPLLGDEGSGWAIGVAALRRACRASDGREAATGLGARLLERLDLARAEELVPWAASASRAEVAALASTVAEAADEGDPAADAILAEAAIELAAAVAAVRRRLEPWERSPSLALAGGLLAPGRPMRARAAEAVSGLGIPCLEEAVDPARGAARLALTFV